MENKKTKYLVMSTVFTIILATIGISYAYFRGTVKGEGEHMSVNFDKVYIQFTDDTEIADNTVRPGWSTTKNFTVENQGTTDFSYDIYVKNFISTLETENYFQYKITSTNGYNMTDFEPLPKSPTATNQDLATGINVPAGVTQEYTIEFRYVNDPNVNQNADKGKAVSGQLMIEAQKSPFKQGTLARKILDNATTINTRTDFDSVFGDTTATTGVIYKESTYRETGENNNKDVYYFAGNVADNWVQFAGKMWRIIRTNEDGSVRLLYHGTSTTATNSYITTSVNYNSSSYVGYMYGSTGSIENNRNNTTSSVVKTTIDNWYKSNILSSYDGYVSKTAIYCNDRASGQYSSSGSMYYAAYSRLYGNQTQKRQPTYQCGQNSREGYYNTSGNWTTLSGAYTSSPASVADKFSANTGSGGNGQLQYPIALMTADEVSFAGGKYGTEARKTYYYLNSSGGSSTGSDWWWTMSPYYFDSYNNAHVFCVRGSSSHGCLYSTGIGTTHAVRPVLSLKSCVEWESGDGTPTNPYKVKLNDTCSLAVN